MLKTGLFYVLLLGLAGCVTEKNLEVSPMVGDTARVAQAQQFEPIQGRANLYIKMKGGHNKLLVDDRKQGVLKGGPGATKEGEYFNFSVNPGIVNFSFRRPFDPRNDHDHLKHLVFADFDLDFAAGSVVLIECESSELDFTLSNGIYTRPPGKALRKFESCPKVSDLTTYQGTKACAKPYQETTFSFDISSEGWRSVRQPTGQCFLVSDKKLFANAKLMEPESLQVTSLDYELKKAKQLNTVEAFEAVLAMYPLSPRKPEIDQAMKQAQLHQASLARQQQIEDRLKSDAHLPLQVQKDKYMLTLKELLTRQEFEASLFYFELLDTMNVQLSPAVGFFWGEALVRTGSPKPALKKLYAYIAAEGSNGQFYERALVLSSEAEAIQ